ncbi:hypothetical protein A8B75_14535 [Sphingomonadales bacterium EhC05]|nr:hypothetical protein A8B75_14535 [Sphingomonadales bacterium EhC05]
MKAGPIEIGRLLQSRQRFCVPIYQRHYVWTKQKQWEPFWNDVRTKAIECLAGRERRFSHFMGAVVLEARGGYSSRNVTSFQVVDGQQRLTTFQIFLAAARDYAQICGFDKTVQQINDYLVNDKPHLMEEPEVEIYKVWPTQYDRKLFTDIINGDRASLRTKYRSHFYVNRDKIYEYSSVPPLLGAYGYFFDRIKYAVESDDLEDEFAPERESEISDESTPTPSVSTPDEVKLDTLWQALVEEFKIVEIVLEDGDDAQVIFETLNERGEPLLAADLVRNNIFYRADAAGENAEKLFAKHWKSFEDPFWNVKEKQGRYKKDRIEFFLSNFIAAKIAGEVNLTKLFSEYKAFLKPSKKSASPRYLSVAHELQELEKYGAIYKELIDRRSKSSLAKFSRRLMPWDVTTVYPLTLRIWASDMSGAQKKACFDMLLSFIVRRSICGLTTKNYNKFFLMVVASLDASEWNPTRLAQFLLSQTSETGRFPRDEEFASKWTHTPTYTRIQPSKVRAVLEEIELRKRTKFHETSELSMGLTVEHILPRTWQDNWPLSSNTTPTSEQVLAALYTTNEDESVVGELVRRNRLMENIGNLTLLTSPLNSSVSNGPFSKKRKALETHSLLVLNREVTSNHSWNEDAIIKRSKNLFKTAKLIWKFPDEHPNEKEANI